MDFVSTAGDFLSPESQYFKLASVDSEATVASHGRKALLYDIAAKVATVGAAILILGAVAGVTAGVLILTGGNVLATALAGAAMLFIGYGIYRMCFDGFIPIGGSTQKYGIRYLKELSAQHQHLADSEKKVEERAQTLFKNGQASSLSTAKLLGRIQHWSEISRDKERELGPLRKRIRETKEAIFAKRAEGSDSSVEENTLFSLQRDLYRMEVEELGISKVRAAYCYHILHNVNETRSLDEILISQTRGYAQYSDLERQGIPTPVARIPAQKRFITVDEVKEKSIRTLAQELFARQEITA